MNKPLSLLEWQRRLVVRGIALSKTSELLGGVVFFQLLNTLS